jgi:hypothetical protein
MMLRDSKRQWGRHDDAGRQPHIIDGMVEAVSLSWRCGGGEGIPTTAQGKLAVGISIAQCSQVCALRTVQTHMASNVAWLSCIS